MDAPSWLEKARGYIDLGMFDEASKVIASLPEDRHKSPEPASARKARTQKVAPSASDTPAQRAGTKQAQVIEMLQRPDGASIKEIVAATAWLPHTARGVISSALKKRLGLPITSQKEQGRGTVYRLPSA